MVLTSRLMGECWAALHLTCHSLETTATCTLMTAWWERHTFSTLLLTLYELHLLIKVKTARVLILARLHFSLQRCLTSVCVFFFFYRTTPHTQCLPQTSMPACRLCPASTAALLATLPSSPRPTPHPSTAQRESWVRYAIAHLSK